MCNFTVSKLKNVNARNRCVEKNKQAEATENRK